MDDLITKTLIETLVKIAIPTASKACNDAYSGFKNWLSSKINKDNNPEEVKEILEEFEHNPQLKATQRQLQRLIVEIPPSELQKQIESLEKLYQLAQINNSNIINNTQNINNSTINGGTINNTNYTNNN